MLRDIHRHQAGESVHNAKRESDKATLTHGRVSCVSHFEPART